MSNLNEQLKEFHINDLKVYQNILRMVFNFHRISLPASYSESLDLTTFLQKCAEKFQRTLVSLRLLASCNGKGELHGAPYGKIKVTKSFIFSYITLANGFKNAVLSANLYMPLTDAMSSFQPHQLVLMYVLMMLETVCFKLVVGENCSIESGTERNKFATLGKLVELVHQRVKETCIREGIFAQCELLLTWIRVMEVSGMLDFRVFSN